MSNAVESIFSRGEGTSEAAVSINRNFQKNQCSKLGAPLKKKWGVNLILSSDLKIFFFCMGGLYDRKWTENYITPFFVIILTVLV